MSPDESRLKLWNVSSSRSLLHLPSIFHHLPHLLDREDSLLPAVHVGQGRTGGKSWDTAAPGGHRRSYTSLMAVALGDWPSHLSARLSAVSIVMGVPSVKRDVHSYLTDTLSSLMSQLSAAEKDDCVIVVLIAEVGGFNRLNFIDKTSDTITMTTLLHQSNQSRIFWFQSVRHEF